MLIPFVKMHGLGNDYIYIDDRAEDMSDPSEVARVVSNRHRGIGGDGIILIQSFCRFHSIRDLKRFRFFHIS